MSKRQKARPDPVIGLVREWPGNSWPELLKKTVVTTIPTKQGGSAGGGGLKYCFNCRYSILVRDHFKLPKRTYIWKGSDSGGSRDLNGDGVIADIPATETKPGVQEKNLPDVPWCFAYGEKEWLSGKLWKKVKDTARGDLLAEPPIQPNGRIDCEIGKSYE